MCVSTSSACSGSFSYVKVKSSPPECTSSCLYYTSGYTKYCTDSCAETSAYKYKITTLSPN